MAVERVASVGHGKGGVVVGRLAVQLNLRFRPRNKLLGLFVGTDLEEEVVVEIDGGRHGVDHAGGAGSDVSDAEGKLEDGGALDFIKTLPFADQLHD